MLTAPSVDASGNPISMASPKAEERGEEPPGGWTFEPSAPEDCANGVDDDADNRSDCFDPDCWNACGCDSGPGDRALWFNGKGAPRLVVSRPLVDELLGAGAAGVDDTTNWPGSLLSYHLVFLVVPAQDFTVDEKADISEYLVAGGTLILVGEAAGFTSGYINVFADLNSTLGTTTTWQSQSLDSLCDKYATPVAVHPLTEGVNSFTYAYGTDLNLSVSAQELAIGESGQTLMAIENDIIFFTDTNVLSDGCSVTVGDQQLYQNLWGGGAPAADTDGDGVHDICDYCPGSDDLADVDLDNEPDGCDACVGVANDADANGDGIPDVAVDTDLDGLPDVCDLCPLDNPDDLDGDGQCDSGDTCIGFDDLIDTDGDGTADGCDPCPLDVADDVDGDGVCDGVDQCPGFDDGLDGDSDGVPDDCDACPVDPLDDSDGDGVCDSDDICAGFDDTEDSDGDRVPDGCDPCPLDVDDDSDGDGVCDSDDLCPNFDDAIDGDLDGNPDACDPCPYDVLDDSDGDGVCDSDDVCPGGNDLADGDGDGVPNDCDPCPFDNPDDSDGDGICDRDDICDGYDTVDTDADGVPDDCDLCPNDPVNDDSDLDGVCDVDDICAGFDDTLDMDEDGVPDGCDPCPQDNPDDNDGDGICNSADGTPDGDPEEAKGANGGGCACDSGGVPSGWMVVGLLAVAISRRRRR